MKTILATDVKVGDVLSVNTGYRPFDDENCEVLKIERGVTGLFPQDTVRFYIKSHYGNHWYDVPVEMRYGDKVYQTTLTKVDENSKTIRDDLV